MTDKSAREIITQLLERGITGPSTADAILAALEAGGFAVVPQKSTRVMLNAAVDVDHARLGDISPLGFRCSPQQLFEECWSAMLAASNPKEEGSDNCD